MNYFLSRWAGSLPGPKLKLVQAWIEIHREDLLADWKLAIAGEPIFILSVHPIMVLLGPMNKTLAPTQLYGTYETPNKTLHHQQDQQGRR